MLIEPSPTPYDLRWRMFGTAVRVHPFFWLLALLLGWSWFLVGGFSALLIWVACVFVSILVHEFGHALAMRFFGLRASVVLYSFGGLAIPQGGYHSRGEKIIVSLAGPAAGLALFGLIYATNHAYGWEERGKYALVLYECLFFINLFWNLLNLVPIFPLDGGQVSREVLSMSSRRNGEKIAFAVSALIAGVLAVHGFMAYSGRPLLPWLPLGGLWMGILFAMLAIQNIQLYQFTQRRSTFSSGWDDDRSPWQR